MTAIRKRAGTVAALSGACLLALAQPALAAPKIDASKTTGLKAGDTITVTVTGLTPGETFVTLGLCEPKPKLPTDCAAQSTGAAIQGTSDSGGNFLTQAGAKEAKLKMVAKAGDVTCASKAGACVVAVTALGANMAANTAEIPLTFTGGGGGDGGGGDGTGGGDTGGGGGGDGGALPNTGSPDGLPTYALIASALIMASGAVLFIIPRRRRNES
ncbi:neocarzinostatin apoprotein domain-containing protein [Actinomadura rugatobispora]|uniref:Neocarzinostatin apoprotein domain-containing protein n=1 Tax=Actinomadura rugatobispora TaxID=1994 RepID=A0ABW1AC09_9ACTN|nr:neocarzinostatin apoprotein domain-containing protein [Actinomadura rugatobispora]